MARNVDFQPPHIPAHWPKWPVFCDQLTSTRRGARTGPKCKNRAGKGDTRCRMHGCAGKRAQRAFKRYLMWLLIGHPEGRVAVSQIGVQSVARYMLAPEERFESHITVEDKVKAAIYLMELPKTITPRRDVVEVLCTECSLDHDTAIQIAQSLSHFGWLREVA